MGCIVTVPSLNEAQCRCRARLKEIYYRTLSLLVQAVIIHTLLQPAACHPCTSMMGRCTAVPAYSALDTRKA
jgi:hypothetical protein